MNRKAVLGLVSLATFWIPACSDPPVQETWSIVVGDRLSVAPGLVVPEPGWIWTAVAPAELEVEAVMCEPQPSVRTWKPLAHYETATSSNASRYGVGEPEPTYPRLRAWVAMTPGNADGSDRPNPWVAGTLYGVSEVLEPTPCGPNAVYPPSWPACYSGLLAAEVVIASTFSGCD